MWLYTRLWPQAPGIVAVGQERAVATPSPFDEGGLKEARRVPHRQLEGRHGHMLFCCSRYRETWSSDVGETGRVSSTLTKTRTLPRLSQIGLVAVRGKEKREVTRAKKKDGGRRKEEEEA